MDQSVAKPTYKRQRFLLAFIRQLNEDVTVANLQKLVFLYTMKTRKPYYDFVPYKFGCYSFQLQEDLNILCKKGFISMQQHGQTEQIMALNGFYQEMIFDIASERDEELIQRTHQEYPYYSINSEIPGCFFNEQQRKSLSCVKEHYAQAEQLLFTIGYEGKTLESFINILIQYDIRLLCDVRRNPLSRKFGFSKRKLEYIMREVGIRYIHIPELGIESSKRRSLETLEDYRYLFADYEKTLPNHKEVLERIYELLRSDVRIALMCFEREPEKCHRNIIKNHIANEHKVRSIDI